MIVRPATRDDDSGITALMESVPLSGSMRIAMACRPSFFQALRVEGETPVVAVAEDRGQIVAVGAVIFRKVHVNGRAATQRYLSALRVAPHARGSLALAHGFAHLRRELKNHPADLTLTAILEDNTAALATLTSKRAGLPPYDPLCRCVTRVVTARHAPNGRRSNEIQVCQDAMPAEIAAFIASHGPSRNFFPQCQAEDLSARADSAFPGLGAEDFLVARDGSGRILGIMGCWDVSRFRQAVVTGYAGWLRWARPWINLGARCAKRPPLPPPGQFLGLAYACMTLIRDGDPRVFRGLLESALDSTRRRGLGHFVIALAAHDPWLTCFHGLPHRDLHSTIFRVHFDDPSSQPGPDGRMPHFEGAML